jgi:hypothetical protein
MAGGKGGRSSHPELLLSYYMIRFHKIPTVPPNLTLVSAKRKARGYVMPDIEAIEVCSCSPTRATWTTKLMHGWRAVGFNGRLSKLFSTKRTAALHLVSNHHFSTSSPSTAR